MSVQAHEPIDWHRITFARARILREIGSHRTEREIAEGLQESYNGVRSQIDKLKEITGCRDLREMGRWRRPTASCGCFGRAAPLSVASLARSAVFASLAGGGLLLQ